MLKRNLIFALMMSALAPRYVVEADAAGSIEGLTELDDMDSLLDADLGSIEDLPDFVTPPNGFYKLHIKKLDKKKEIKDKKGVMFLFSVVETIQLNNAAEAPVKEGSLFSQIFFPDTSVEKVHAWRWLKKAVKGYSESIGSTTLGQTLDTLNDQVITAVVVCRPNDPKTPTAWYPQVDKMMPA